MSLINPYFYLVDCRKEAIIRCQRRNGFQMLTQCLPCGTWWDYGSKEIQHLGYYALYRGSSETIGPLPRGFIQVQLVVTFCPRQCQKTSLLYNGSAFTNNLSLFHTAYIKCHKLLTCLCIVSRPSLEIISL